MKQGWEEGAEWYDRIVQENGHYYHREVIAPKLRELALLSSGLRLLDVGCGQGFFSSLYPEIHYVGIDIAPTFIRQAKERFPHRLFYQKDACSPLHFEEEPFDRVLFLLSLQDMDRPQQALIETARYMKPNGKLILILNHPFFRIPRQSSWGEDESKKVRYRRVDRYLTPLSIPIQLAPSRGKESPNVLHHHFPLSLLSRWILEAGYRIEQIEEWISNRTSTGSRSKQENRARGEFPLFMAIIASN